MCLSNKMVYQYEKGEGEVGGASIEVTRGLEIYRKQGHLDYIE